MPPVLPDVDVRVRAEDAIAQLLLEPGHQRERDDQRHDADRDAERRDERDDRDERLLALGEQVAQRDVQLEGTWSMQSRSRPHQRKQDHVADRRAVGQQHHQPVDADAFARRSAAARTRARGCSPRPSRAPRGRRARRSCELRLEPPALLVRIVQLAEGVGHLEAADVELEALDRVGIVRLLLRQRRHLGREVVDEGRLNQPILAERLEDLGRDLPGPVARLDLDAELPPPGRPRGRGRAGRRRSRRARAARTPPRAPPRAATPARTAPPARSGARRT